MDPNDYPPTTSSMIPDPESPMPMDNNQPVQPSNLKATQLPWTTTKYLENTMPKPATECWSTCTYDAPILLPIFCTVRTFVFKWNFIVHGIYIYTSHCMLSVYRVQYSSFSFQCSDLWSTSLCIHKNGLHI